MLNFDVTEMGSIRVRSVPKFGDREISIWRFRIFGPFGLIRFRFFSFSDFRPFFSPFRGDWVGPDSESRSVGTRRGLILFRFFLFRIFPHFPNFFPTFFPQKNKINITTITPVLAWQYHSVHSTRCWGLMLEVARSIWADPGQVWMQRSSCRSSCKIVVLSRVPY